MEQWNLFLPVGSGRYFGCHKKIDSTNQELSSGKKLFVMNSAMEKSHITNFQDALWNTMFAELILFKKKHGHCNVSTRRSYKSLHQWCVSQRVNKKYEHLKFLPSRTEKLNSIGFCWNILDQMFEKKFQKLLKFYKKHRHCNVTRSQNKVLAKWCQKLRHEKKRRKVRLTAERIRKLNSIGFEWEVIDSRWMKNYKSLKKYVEKKKHFFNFSDMKQYRQLASFVHNHRVQRKAGILSKEKINLLNKTGFIWDTVHSRWENHFEELKKYKMLFGHCNVSKGIHDKNFKRLADWVKNQRVHYRKRNPLLTQERIKKLSQLGFHWTSPFKAGEQNRISDTDMLNDLKRLQTLLHKTPSILDIRKHGKYSDASYYNHFKSISNARKEADLKSIICRQKKKL